MPSSFRLSDAHLQAFEAQQRGRFVEEMLAYLRQHYAPQVARRGESAVRALIEFSIVRTRDYHLTRECDVGRFIQLQFEIAEDFDTSDATPWAREILADDSRLSFEKLEAIAQRWATGAREEAARE